MSLLGIPFGFYSIADLKTICLSGWLAVSTVSGTLGSQVSMSPSIRRRRLLHPESQPQSSSY
jgi:hypothetical protein